MVALLVGCLGFLVACAEDDGLACVDIQEPCAPLYEPTFDEIFSRTLVPSCALPGSGCHAAQGAAANLVFDDPDGAYDQLVGATNGRVLVDPVDPSCSILLMRLEASTPSVLMPPGTGLSAQERCVLKRWVIDGAQR